MDKGEIETRIMWLARGLAYCRKARALSDEMSNVPSRDETNELDAALGRVATDRELNIFFGAFMRAIDEDFDSFIGVE